MCLNTTQLQQISRAVGLANVSDLVSVLMSKTSLKLATLLMDVGKWHLEAACSKNGSLYAWYVLRSFFTSFKSHSACILWLQTHLAPCAMA